MVVPAGGAHDGPRLHVAALACRPSMTWTPPNAAMVINAVSEYNATAR